MTEQKRPLHTITRVGNKIVNLIVFILMLLLLLYSAYSIWYTNSLKSGSFLANEIAMYKPTGKEPTLSDLMEVNPDVRSWLTIDDTNIDYPVVQGKTDFDYLNRDVMGRFSLMGAIFLSVENSPDFSDSYNVIYGHNIEGGAMFADIMEFRDPDYFNDHTSGALWLPDKAYFTEIFACMEADALDPVIYQPPKRVTRETLPEVISYIYENALCSREAEILPDDSIIVLSTCEDANSFNRVVLFAKLVEMSEEEMHLLELQNLEEQEAVLGPDAYEKSMPHLSPWLLLPVGVGLLILLILLLTRFRRRD